MPHRIVYDEDAATVYLKTCPWKQRLSGKQNTNRPMPWADYADQNIRDVEFHSSRLFLISQGYITSSRNDDVFNLWVDNVNAVSDSDRISTPVTPSDVGAALRATSLDRDLLVIAEHGQISFTSGDTNTLTNSNGVPVGITDFESQDVPLSSTGAAGIVADDLGDVHLYQWREGIVYASLLTAHYQSALYGHTIDRIFYIGSTIFMTTSGGTVITHDSFFDSGQIEQSAWGTLEFYEDVVFVHSWGGYIRVVTKDSSSDANGYSMLRYRHRDQDAILSLPFIPHVDRLEQVSAGAMTYDSVTDRTTIPHSGREGSLANSILVTNSPAGDGVGVFVRPVEIDSGGDPVFSGKWDDATQALGFSFDCEFDLTRLYPGINGRKARVKDANVYVLDSTDFTASYTQHDGSERSHGWQAHRVGVTEIGAARTETTFERVGLNGVDSDIALTISSSSPGPLRVTAVEFIASQTGRGVT